MIRCCCGEPHEQSAAYDDAVKGLPLTVVVKTADGIWRVPRVYLAAHGLNSSELPDLAAVYDWERVLVL